MGGFLKGCKNKEYTPHGEEDMPTVFSSYPPWGKKPQFWQSECKLHELWRGQARVSTLHWYLDVNLCFQRRERSRKLLISISDVIQDRKPKLKEFQGKDKNPRGQNIFKTNIKPREKLSPTIDGPAGSKG